MHKRLFRPDVAEDVDDELSSHLAEARDDFIARGLSPDEANAAARRRFGNVAAIARSCREIDERLDQHERRARMWTDLRQDIGYALRLFARAPGFTITAILTLALGIGATTAIFSLANWVLLRPIAGVEQPGELLQVWSGIRQGPSSFTPSFVSYPNLADIAGRLNTVELAGIQGGLPNVAKGQELARPVPAHFVAPNYFSLLGVRFTAGRPFTPDEDRAGSGATVAVVSASFARATFGSESAALGEVVQINGVPFTVIGVPGGGFHGTDRINRVDLWLPGRSGPIVDHRPQVRFDKRDGGGFYDFVARPKAGSTVAQIEAELTGLGPWLAAQHPKENEKFAKVGFHVLAPAGTHPLMRTSIVKTMWLMLGLSALVLLIACSNVASLLLMRGIGRQTEVAVRTALGASRRRVIRQYLTEGTLLWLAGGIGALGFTWLALRLLEGGALLGLRGDVGPAPLDWRVVAFAGVLSLVVGAAFSLMPAVRAARVAPGATLKLGSGSAAPRHLRVGSALTAVQLATSLTLVVGALLLAATVRQLSTVDVGFDPHGVYAFYVRPGSVGYDMDRAVQYRDEFSRRLALVPGVERVATAARAPFSGPQMFTRLRAVGGEAYVRSSGNDIISASYFETLRIPLLKGRVFTEQDLGANGAQPRDVVMLSAGLAQDLFGAEDPIGRRIEFGTMGLVGKPFEVVGVVGDVRVRSLTGEVDPMVYQPEGVDERPFRTDAMFIVRARHGVDVAAEVRTIAGSLNPALPVINLSSLDAAVEASQGEWTRLAQLLTALAAIAGVLAAVGLYGVIAFGVAARRREFGIRLALGAPPAQVMTLVFRRTAVLTAVGLALGAGGALVLSRALESRLFGVTPFDLRVWLAAALILVGTALVASWLPARRAARVEVVDALRI